MIAVDIVIPSAGRPDLLLALLDSLARQTPQPGQAADTMASTTASTTASIIATITVTDDRHTADTGRRVHAAHPSVRYVAGPARGPAANRNHGAARGQAPWLLFLDDDCHLDSNLLARYADHARADPAAQVLEGAILPVGQRPSALHHAPINSDGGFLWSCNFMIKRQLFDSLGGFDPRFPYALEDCDFMQRLRERGVRVPFVRAAVVRHPWRAISLTELARQLLGHAVMADKHPVFVAGWTPRHVLRALRGRVRQYTGAGLGTLGLRAVPTAVCDFLAPVAMWGAVRIKPLRRALVRRAQLLADQGARHGLPGVPDVPRVPGTKVPP